MQASSLDSTCERVGLLWMKASRITPYEPVVPYRVLSPVVDSVKLVASSRLTLFSAPLTGKEPSINDA